MRPSISNTGLPFISLFALTLGCGNAASEDGTVSQSTQPLCTAVTLTTDDADRIAAPGQTVTWTATPTCTGTPEYRFNLRAPDGTWTVPQDWGPSNTFVWNTTGLPAGSYNMQLWVRDASGPPTSYQKYVGVYFELRSTTPCETATTTVTPASTTLNQNVTVTTSASPCTGAEYEVYKKAPGGSFQLLSAYSPANANFVWDSTNAPAGTHTFQVWVRSAGSTLSYEAKAPSKDVTLSSSAPCIQTQLSFSPPTTAPVGTSVTLSAAAQFCTQPTYRFFIKPPGGSFQLLQDWTIQPSLNWNTAFATPGQYTFQIHVRNAGSMATYETYITKNYTLTAATPTGALAIGGGWQHHAALLADGRVASWGYNGQGQMGNGTTNSFSKVPIAATGISPGIALGVGYYHTCAAVPGGGVRCWGQNSRGQLGNGTTTASSTPVVTTGLSGAVALAGGLYHSCAVLGSGEVRCWGYNNQGQLGDGTKTNRTTPVAVVNGGVNVSGIATVSAGFYHTCSLSKGTALLGGSVYCWGYNVSGALGNGTTTSSLAPVPVTGMDDVIQISSFNANNCAVKREGSLFCWGANSADGVLGSGGTSVQTTAQSVGGITNARQVSVGEAHSCAALQNGTAVCWGSNVYGALGNGTNTSSPVPVPVSNLTNVKEVAVSNGVSCATLTDNTMACWGRGSTGELGNGGTASSNVPVTVTPLP